MKQSTPTRSDLAFAYELQSEGVPWKEIERQLGICRSTLIKRINLAKAIGLNAQSLRP